MRPIRHEATTRFMSSKWHRRTARSQKTDDHMCYAVAVPDVHTVQAARTDTIIIIETLVYSLQQNKLVWGGQSKSKNPANLARLIEDTAKQVADELVRQGLIAKEVKG